MRRRRRPTKVSATPSAVTAVDHSSSRATSDPVPGNGNGSSPSSLPPVPGSGTVRRTVTRFDTPDTASTVVPDDETASAVAMLSMRLRVTSAWVTVRVAEHVIDCPGASERGGQLTTVATLSLTVTCTNRDLPAQMPFSGGIGGDLVSEHIAPFLKIQCLSKPTPSRRRDVGRGAHWRLISHLSLNYLSLVEHGPDALRGILELYDVSDSPVTRRQIAGLRNVSASRVVRNVNGAFCRGLKVAVEFDAEHFAGTNSYLLASVLDRFLGLYVSINSFSQLVARVAPDDGVVNSWPPRAGEQTLL